MNHKIIQNDLFFCKILKVVLVQKLAEPFKQV